MGPRKKSKPNKQACTSPSETTKTSASASTAASDADQANGHHQRGQREPRPEQIALPEETQPERSPTRSNTSTSSPALERLTQISRSRSASLQDTAEQGPSASKSNWRLGGSWRAKASPVAQATRESISVAGGATSEALAEGARQTGRYMHNTLKRSSTKSIPLAATETHVTATASNSELKQTSQKDEKNRVNTEDVVMKDAEGDGVEGQSQTHIQGGDEETRNGTLRAPKADQDAATETDASQTPSQQQQQQPPPPPARSGWFGWWSRPDDYPGTPENNKERAEEAEAQAQTEAQAERTTMTDAAEAQVDNAEAGNEAMGLATPPIQIDASQAGLHPCPPGQYGSARSWFGLWSSTQNKQVQDAERDAPKDAQEPETTTAPEAAEQEQTTNTAADSNENNPADDSPQRPKPSGWAFWSRERGPDDDGTATPSGPQKRIGELAVADTPSQSHPEAAQFNEQKQRAKDQSSKKEARLGQTLNRDSSALSTPKMSPPSTRAQTPEPNKVIEATKASAVGGKGPLQAPKPVDRGPQKHPNLIIPLFDDTYNLPPSHTYWERLSSYVASSLRLIDPPPPPQHVHVSPTLPKVRNAIAIGVHGYFPAPLIQKVLGQPTGTSIRFANYASAAIRTWAEKNQPEIPCEIENVALEGEGFIADRVATLWKLLLNWLSHLRQADLILVACHSQGVPVAIMLVSKLIQLGCLSKHVRVGVCAMAGVNLGPFADYKSRLLGAGSAAELFEFSRPHSRVSTEYAHSLDVVLRHGVRITYVGSIDDQLVSLESSTFTTLTHPYINRLLFVDGRIHAPSFLTHLVAFSLKLRNLGISDHGLIRELSLPLAGSLYGGEGHSRVYDDPTVYDAALRFTLETTDVEPQPYLPPTTTTQARRSSSGGAEGSLEALTAEQRRSSRGGPPATLAAAEAMRRGDVSSSTLSPIGIAPILTHYEVPASGANANPYFLPWALRGILEEERVKLHKDQGGFREEVRQLVEEYEAWKPDTKVLKDVRWRLEGVRSKL